MLDFNSHARVGRDVNWMGDLFWMIISTHTPAWGVTFCVSNLPSARYISTHTPAWGVTPIVRAQCCIHSISTHTPAWGVTF